MAAAAILKNGKIAVSQQWFDPSLRNLVQRSVTVTHTIPLDYFDRQNVEMLKIHDGGNRNSTRLTGRRHPTLSILRNKTANIIKQNWDQFLLVVKATSL